MDMRGGGEWYQEILYNIYEYKSIVKPIKNNSGWGEGKFKFGVGWLSD